MVLLLSYCLNKSYKGLQIVSVTTESIHISSSSSYETVYYAMLALIASWIFMIARNNWSTCCMIYAPSSPWLMWLFRTMVYRWRDTAMLECRRVGHIVTDVNNHRDTVSRSMCRPRVYTLATTTQNIIVARKMFSRGIIDHYLYYIYISNAPYTAL